MDALYREARADGMVTTTLADAVARLAPTLAQPRVVAFPSLAASGWYAAATIDAHDSQIGLTFIAGETMLSRVFPYAFATTSRFDAPDPQLPTSQMPTLLGAAAANGILSLHFEAPVATRFGVAFWSDPTLMGWTSPNVVPAGHAGAVAFFDLAAGEDTITLGCRACVSMTFSYAGT